MQITTLKLIQIGLLYYKRQEKSLNAGYTVTFVFGDFGEVRRHLETSKKTPYGN